LRNAEPHTPAIPLPLYALAAKHPSPPGRCGVNHGVLVRLAESHGQLLFIRREAPQVRHLHRGTAEFPGQAELEPIRGEAKMYRTSAHPAPRDPEAADLRDQPSGIDRGIGQLVPTHPCDAALPLVAGQILGPHLQPSSHLLQRTPSSAFWEPKNERWLS